MENREQPKITASMLVPQEERGKDNTIFKGNPDVDKSSVRDLPAGESLEIVVSDIGDIEVLSQEQREAIKNNLNRRMTPRALAIKQQLKEQSSRDMRKKIDDEMSK